MHNYKSLRAANAAACHITVHLGPTRRAISGNGIKIIDSRNCLTTLAKTHASEWHRSTAARQNPRQRFVTSDLFLCSRASSPHYSSITESGRFPSPAAHGPTANYLFLRQRVIMVQMADAVRLFLDVCYFWPAMFNPDVHLPAAPKDGDGERFVVVVSVVVAVFVAKLT